MAQMSFGQQQNVGNSNSFNTNNSYNSTVNYITTIDDEGDQILRWLSPLEPQQRHQGVRTDRLNGVGNWVLETSEFRKWRDPEDGGVGPVLFCYGNPGVGKTYVCSLVIDSLCDEAEGKDIAVVGLYCDFLAKQELSTLNVLGAMLKQVARRGGIPEQIREGFQKAKKKLGRGLLLPEMVDILKQTIAPLPRLFICVDALDECAPKHRRDLLESLREIVAVSPNIRVFLTGRPHIEREIVNCFSQAVRIPLTPHRADIKSYLEMRLDCDTDPDTMNDELRADIMRIIPEVSESFLLVSLNVDAILGEVTLHERRRKLGEMTKGEDLGETYAATISRIQAQPGSRSRIGIEVLMWVSHAERPLHVDELCHALGVVKRSTDLNIQNTPRIGALLSCSLGLVTVEKSSSTVRLVHYTLQEYLSHNTNLFPNPHSLIAEVCLTYLNFRRVQRFSPGLRSVPRTAPFVEYASCYWGAHARRETTESVKALALKLLDRYDEHISSKVLLLRGARQWEQPFDQGDTPRGFTGLHGAAYLGCVEIVVALLEINKWGAQATDLNGFTAIAWAARWGHEEVVRVLLERSNVNPDKAGKWNRTPLWLAAESGHEGVVRMLLARSDVNPDHADDFSETPLFWASRNGHEGVVKMLLDRIDANPEAASAEYCKQRLLLAAENGEEGIVKTLLGRKNTNPDEADEWDRTPLRLAAQNGHEGVVRALLARGDVNPNHADHLGQTPLLLASRNGHEGVVKMLEERDGVNPKTAGTEYCQQWLLLAAKNGEEGIVKALLKRSDINPDEAGKWNRTPLWWAAANGHEGVVRMLLARGGVDPGHVDEFGETPLFWASTNRHVGVVRVLQQRNDVNTNMVDKRRPTPPLRAVKDWVKRIAKRPQ